MPAPTDIYTLSLHDALPIWPRSAAGRPAPRPPSGRGSFRGVQEHAAGLAALDRRAPLDQGAALRRDRGETVAAGVAVEGVQRQGCFAAANALVARQERGAEPGGGALALREGPLALGRDLLALAGERLAQRGLPGPHVVERPLGFRRLALRFRHCVPGAHELGLLLREHRAREVQLRHEGRGFLRAPHPLEALAPLLLHGAIVGDLALQLVAPIDGRLNAAPGDRERALRRRLRLIERR